MGGVTAIFRITGMRFCSSFQVRLLRHPVSILEGTLFAEKNLQKIYRRVNCLYTSPICNIPNAGKANEHVLQVLLQSSAKAFYYLNETNLVENLIVSRDSSNLISYAQFSDKQTFIAGLNRLISYPNFNDTMVSSLEIFRQNALYNLPDIQPYQAFTIKPRP